MKKLISSLVLVLSFVLVSAQEETAVRLDAQKISFATEVSIEKVFFTSQVDVKFKKFGEKDGFSFCREYALPVDVSFEEIQDKVSSQDDLGMVFVDGENKIFSLRGFGFQAISNPAYIIQKLAMIDERTGSKYAELLSIFYKKDGKIRSLETTVEEDVDYKLSTDAGVLRVSVEAGRITLGFPNRIGMFLATK